ncbi:MAG: ATP-binding protein [Fibrobacter sp.]|nr:ATP-binding protein [Fibrobacter sp.]
MPYDYKKTDLWNQTLAQKDEKNQEYIDELRTSFLQIHDKVASLLEDIKKIFPEYTMHDISHSDALWNMADIILEKSNMKLNPLEGYVLGCSFLFHDLGMSPIAYENRSIIENTDLWKDSFSFYLKYGLSDETARQKADEETIRKNHSQNAKGLPLKQLSSDSTFIIENVVLRKEYGPLIGEISASHGVSVENLENIFTTNIKGSIGEYLNEWKINTIKIACILRVADAIHITSDRTPYILWAANSFNEESSRHWIFQSKMNKPVIDNGRLVFTSSSSFTINERESWWLCYDVLKMINQELLDVDALFCKHNIGSLSVWCVKNIDNPKALSTQITVDGWVPVDSKMKVTNVSGLIKSLGGESLYGKNDFIPLRELIQNASDAIRARRLLDGNEDSWGDIHIRVEKNSDETLVEIEDNGIGMSDNVLTGPFLDFGTSFWHSELMRSELPGLENRDFKSTGHFGIGFFSVFMWGDIVSITTRRYDEERAKTRILEFNSGVKSRPLLRMAKKSEQLKDGGTKIRVYIKRQWPSLSNQNAISLENYLKYQFPCLDCNLFLKEGNQTENAIISANDWISLDSYEFLKRVLGHSFHHDSNVSDDYLKEISKHVQIIKDENNHIYGRGTLNAKFQGLLSDGGIRVSSTHIFTGVLLAECHVANRYSATPIVPESVFKTWLENQRNLIIEDSETQKQLFDFNYPWKFNISCFLIPSLLYLADVPVGKIPVALYCGEFVTYEQIKQVVKETNFDKYFVFTSVPVGERFNELKFEKNVFVTLFGEHVISSYNENVIDEHLVSDGECFPKRKTRSGLSHIIADACAEVWQQNVEDIEIMNNKRCFEVLGTCKGLPIKGSYTLLITRKDA